MKGIRKIAMFSISPNWSISQKTRFIAIYKDLSFINIKTMRTKSRNQEQRSCAELMWAHARSLVKICKNACGVLELFYSAGLDYKIAVHYRVACIYLELRA